MIKKACSVIASGFILLLPVSLFFTALSCTLTIINFDVSSNQTINSSSSPQNGSSSYLSLSSGAAASSSSSSKTNLVTVVSNFSIGSLSLAYNNKIPYIAFIYGDNTGMQAPAVDFYKNNSWVQLGAFLSTDQCSNTSITFDSSGNPYVVFQDLTSNNIPVVMTWIGTGWIPLNNSSLTNPACFPSIACYSDSLYLTYENLNTGGPDLYEFIGYWSNIAAGVSGNGIQYTSLTFQNGNPFLLYATATGKFLGNIYSNSTSSWYVLSGNPTGDSISFISSACDSSGYPYSACLDGQNINIYIYSNNAWSNIGSSPVYGQINSLSLAFNGNAPNAAFTLSNSVVIMPF